MGPQIGGYITPGQRLLSDPDVRANTGNGDTWSAADTQRDVHLTDLALNPGPVVEMPWRWIMNYLPRW